jgi:hypothetical protein
MLLTIISALQLAAAGPGQIYNARDGHTAVQVPTFDARVTVDGVLDEPVWKKAAVLTGFSEYEPVDSRPAPDSTEVLVWYSPEAIYFGIRAMAAPGQVRATLADRDKVSSDDNVEIQLDTYNERNRAMVFAVNPLGVQADGIKNEGGGYTPGAPYMTGQVDLSPDYLWDSKGRLTEWGYEVEIRIPFSSLRYPTKSVQDWGIQIQRNVQHNGYTETWTPAIRAAASFIDQEGLLVGLKGMRHGQVVQLNPELTNTVKGAPSPTSGHWSYDSKPRLGGNVRWMVGSNFILNGTVKPDFSQVEADATQIAADERFAISYPEKRPFFVEGAEQFSVPNTLVYTRTIVQPAAAVKLTGKVGRTDVAVLSALDDGSTTPNGQRPVVDIVRLRRGFATQSTAGLLYSERIGGGRSNRVFDADVRHVFGRMYYAQFQGVLSRTSEAGVTTDAPLWEAVVDRTGRKYGFHYDLLGIGQDFAADNGFIQRTDIVRASAENRFSAYGAPGSAFERYNAMLHMQGTWRYADFFKGRSVLEDQLALHNDLTLRGGWGIGVNPGLGTYAFDPADYARVFSGTVQQPVPFVPSNRITTFTTEFQVTTPQYSTFSASLSLTAGNDVDFLETSRVRRLDYNASLDARPTQQIRIEATYQSMSFHRLSDHELTTSTRIPRLKVEYQVNRSVFLRLVAQYTATERAPLKDPHTGQTLLVQAADGTVAPSTRTQLNQLRADWLFSYRPSPGTVFFLGYGNTLTEPDLLGLKRLHPVNDAFFVKVSYLFHALGA